MKFKIKSQATSVASPRSRAEKKKTITKLKAGEAHQQDFTKMIEKLFGEIDAQLEVEPKGVKITPETIIGMINKKDKKKLN